MAFWKVVALCLLGVNLTHGTGSPHGDDISHMFGPTSNYAVDVLEDARLDAFSLIRKYGYPAEIHRVITEDGYVLEMHRIRHGRDQNNDPSVDRPVVFLMHGIMSSSADWVNMGPNQGFGYILAEEGYDVWMGNARGNFYSRNHISLNPDGLLNRRFWDFSWHEIGNIDLPSMIDYILQETGKESLHYIGHSQGTTSFFVMTSTKPEYNAKIKSMHALAPIAFFEHVTSLLLRALAPFSGPLATITTVLGLGEFVPNTEIMTWAGIAVCYEETTITSLCGNIVSLIGGINEQQVNQTMIPVKLGHTPAGASNKQFAHFGQGINDGRFRQYDLGIISNLIEYGSVSPPDYDLSLVTAPVALHYSLNDNLAHENDVLRLFRELRNPLGLFLVPLPEFTHLDFVWAIDVRSLLYDRVINLMRAFD